MRMRKNYRYNKKIALQKKSLRIEKVNAERRKKRAEIAARYLEVNLKDEEVENRRKRAEEAALAKRNR
jgi:hypothetical protein